MHYLFNLGILSPMSFAVSLLVCSLSIFIPILSQNRQQPWERRVPIVEQVKDLTFQVNLVVKLMSSVRDPDTCIPTARHLSLMDVCTNASRPLLHPSPYFTASLGTPSHEPLSPALFQIQLSGPVFCKKLHIPESTLCFQKGLST